MNSRTSRSVDTAPFHVAGISPWLGVAVLLLAWELAGRFLSDAFVLAAPSDVLRYLAGEWRLMARGLWFTLVNAAAGFVIGNVAAVALAGLALGWPRSAASAAASMVAPLVSIGLDGTQEESCTLRSITMRSEAAWK